jgi:hypothetical protein
MQHPVLPFHVEPHATLTLADAIRLIASTKGPDGASVASKWPGITYRRPSSEDLESILLERKEAGDSEAKLRWRRKVEENGISQGEENALDASMEQLFRLLAGDHLRAFFVPNGEVNPVEISSRTWGIHGYDAVKWDLSAIRVRGLAIENIRIAAEDILRLIEQAGSPKPQETERRGKAFPQKSALSPGRPSFREFDLPLFEEMHKLITDNKAMSANEAASMVAPKAKGRGVEESTVARLRKGYSAWRNMLEKTDSERSK